MDKHSSLRKWFEDKDSVLVAFSGGVDSTLLLKVGYDVLGERLWAVTASSILNTPEELETAHRVAQEIGLTNHIIVEFKDLENPQVKANPHDRCYHCKKARFQAVLELAQEKGIKYVIDGSNIDDLADYRPGLKAVEELGVHSPLQDTAFTKGEIRSLAKELGLTVWNKPSEPCLATRFPVDTPLEEDLLSRVYQGEKFLKSQGLQEVRLRDHGGLARLEMAEADFLKAINIRDPINKELKKLGYRYITLDLGGYQTGSMNITGGE